MLKIAGSILIATASVLYGWKIRQELQEHVRQLVGMKEMFLMLWGEISYTRTPLKEAFLQIASQNKEPFSSFLEEAARGLDENEESVGCFWNGLVEQERDKFLFDEEECGVLKRAGENFGYLDGQMQLKNLELYIEQTEVLIGKAQEELEDKKRLSAVLSVTCGLFLIILLV